MPIKPLTYPILSDKSEKDIYLSLKNETAESDEIFSELPFYGSVSEKFF